MKDIGFVGHITKSRQHKNSYCLTAGDDPSEVIYYHLDDNELDGRFTAEVANALRHLKDGESVECRFVPDFTNPLDDNQREHVGELAFGTLLTFAQLSARVEADSQEIELTIKEIFNRAEKQWDTTNILEECGLNPWCLNEGADPDDMTSVTRKQARLLGISDHEFDLRK